jgi:hypothetical protein
MRAMTRAPSTQPAVRAAGVPGGLLLLLEEWCWEVGSRLARALARWPRWRRWRRACGACRPTPRCGVRAARPAAVCRSSCWPCWRSPTATPVGIAVIVVAKLGGAMVVARIYVLTLPTLLALGWFARCHNRFIMFKDQLIARLRASPPTSDRAGRCGGLRRGCAACAPAAPRPDPSAAAMPAQRARAAPLRGPVRAGAADRDQTMSRP